ncbi:MAG: DUF1688 family protein [Hyphomicrobiales bacterium]|nr:MAG: DUF1688 family protein [Hyphomicrobiales bacterium]
MPRRRPATTPTARRRRPRASSRTPRGARLTDTDAADAQAAAALLTSAAVRERAGMIYAAGLRGDLAHFDVRPDKLDACARFVAETIRANYPALKVPPHARWRHLGANGRDWAERLSPHLSGEPLERARQRIDLAVTSVLLDAGAGRHWRWRDPVTGRDFARSEGLALASLEAFRAGLFSSDPARPARADAEGLAQVSEARLAEVFQVGGDNPLVGIEGRAALLRRLGRQIAEHPQVYGAAPRVGGLVDHLLGSAAGVGVALPHVLAIILTTLGPMWSGRLTLGGIALGDTWQHSAVVVPGPTNGLVPFHKLSQWLTYSLVEPVEDAGIAVRDLDGLTGLAEYRNGGLFLDMGVIALRDPALAGEPLTPDQEPIVEWRALTVALLDAIAPLVRREIGVSAEAMPLASVLEGGTWSAGRRIAQSLRADGGPPLNIVSDGTVF